MSNITNEKVSLRKRAEIWYIKQVDYSQIFTTKITNQHCYFHSTAGVKKWSKINRNTIYSKEELI